jgi:predicted kinase
VKSALDGNFEALTRLGARGAAPDALRAVERFSDAFLAGRRALFEQRLDGGFIRDCHGDLRAEHVIVDDGVRVFDCVEFDPGLRHIDVSADIAFLVMDLELLGAPEAASELLSAYRGAGGDPGPDPLLWFYAAYRACVRAKVAGLRGGAEGEIAALLALGRRLCWRARLPLVLVVCGPAASGKTHLARALADTSGLPHLNSDAVRKELAGLEPGDRARPEHYSDEFSERTYATLGERASAAAGAIVDATFRRERDRRAFSGALGPAPGPVVFAECRAPFAVLVERARLRSRGPSISDAGPELAARQSSEFEPLDEVEPDRHLALRSDRTVDAVADELEAVLDRRLAAGVL